MTRSSSTSRRCSTGSTSTSRAVRRSASATRAAARTTSPATTRTRSCCRCRSPRSPATGASVSGQSAGNANVGVWATTERKRVSVLSSRSHGKRRGRLHRSWTQVSRLGNPLINEVIIPIGLKDKYNRTSPANDGTNFGAAALAPEPARLLNALFGLGVKETGRTDIVQALLTGVPGLTQIGSKPAAADTLKLNLGVPPSANPSRFGVLGEGHRRVPERAPPDRRRRRHRAARHRGGAAAGRQGRQADPAGRRRRPERQAVPLDVPVRRAARLRVRLEAQAQRACPPAGAPAAGLTDPRGQTPRADSARGVGLPDHGAFSPP